MAKRKKRKRKEKNLSYSASPYIYAAYKMGGALDWFTETIFGV
jgi:hypothetical protein